MSECEWRFGGGALRRGLAQRGQESVRKTLFGFPLACCTQETKQWRWKMCWQTAGLAPASLIVSRQMEQVLPSASAATIEAMARVTRSSSVRAAVALSASARADPRAAPETSASERRGREGRKNNFPLLFRCHIMTRKKRTKTLTVTTFTVHSRLCCFDDDPPEQSRHSVSVAFFEAPQQSIHSYQRLLELFSRNPPSPRSSWVQLNSTSEEKKKESQWSWRTPELQESFLHLREGVLLLEHRQDASRLRPRKGTDREILLQLSSLLLHRSYHSHVKKKATLACAHQPARRIRQKNGSCELGHLNPQSISLKPPLTNLSHISHSQFQYVRNQKKAGLKGPVQV